MLCRRTGPTPPHIDRCGLTNGECSTIRPNYGELKGKARLEGATQDLYGQAKDAAASAAEAVGDHAREAEDFIRNTIEQRPYTAAAVALGIGFLIGRFSRLRDD
jgi:ElaB/YqjD/DUF883 family membrane-anchored ribosome-binding protein